MTTFRSATPNILVSDLAAARRFYTEKLGFKVKVDSTENNFIAIERDKVILSLLGSVKTAGTSWCSIIVDDPAPLFAAYQAAGVSILRPLETWGDFSEFSIKDPDGNRIDIGTPML